MDAQVPRQSFSCVLHGGIGDLQEGSDLEVVGVEHVLDITEFAPERF